MDTQEKTLQGLAEEMYDNFESRTRNDESKFYCLKDRIQWQVDVCHKAHGDRLPNDDIYDCIVDALERFSECETEEEMQDSVYELEAPVYTSTLTKWLHSSNYNVYYLTEALEEFDVKDGFQALTIAYNKMQTEVANAILNELVKRLEEIDKE